MSNAIFSNFQLPCGVVLRNRLIKAAMTECLADPVTNSPNEKHLELYRLWGTTQAAVLLTGNIMIDRRHLEAPGNVVVEDERDSEVLKVWAVEAQKNGSQLWAQLSHPGRQVRKKILSFSYYLRFKLFALGCFSKRELFQC